MQLFDPALWKFADEQREFNAKIIAATAGMQEVDTATPEGLEWMRNAMAPGGLFGMQAYDFPEVRTIEGPAGEIPIRILMPEQIDGVYLHLHGGGMTLGSAAAMDNRNWPLAQACRVAVVSVDYRLAPEHPFPAGPDDAEAAALWLIENAKFEFGTEQLLIGGESAGGYLSLLTMVRVRDRLGAVPHFRGMDLCYGVYDLGGTPSAAPRGADAPNDIPYATGEDTNRRHYLPGRSLQECRDPAISPLWARLHGLPPALLTVGTKDWLLDDSTFVAARLAAAGCEVELAVYPEAPHGIDTAPTEMGRVARERLYAFLRDCLTVA
jgi:acetyl esterase/lipase